MKKKTQHTTQQTGTTHNKTFQKIYSQKLIHLFTRIKIYYKCVPVLQSVHLTYILQSYESYILVLTMFMYWLADWLAGWLAALLLLLLYIDM